ncbi:MAG: hypothetical protein ACI4O7_08150 [Aristaeellaceae bacterium]
MNKHMLPLNLQLFADGGEPATDPQGNPTPEPTNNPTAPTAPQTTDQLVQTLLHAIDSRQQRAEKSVLRSMAQQYGLEESELSAMLDEARQRKQAQLPPQVQQQLDQANERANRLLIAAEIKSLGAAMGLIDPEAALQLMNREGITVDDKGAVSGAQQALDALKESKPYLFGQTTQRGSWGQPQGAPAQDDKSGREELREALWGKRN